MESEEPCEPVHTLSEPVPQGEPLTVEKQEELTFDNVVHETANLVD